MLRTQLFAALLSIVLLFPGDLLASDATEGNYLGQEPPGTTPVPFGIGVLPSNAFAGTFHPDLTEFFYNIPASGGGRTAIRGLHLVNGECVKKDFVIPYAFEPRIAPSGDRMFFVIEVRGMGQGYVSVREKGQWGEPQRLPSNANGANHFPMYFCSTPDGELYWTKLSTGAFLVSAPFINGAYTPVLNVAFSLNYRGQCAHPAIASDGSYLLFDAEISGENDLYISFRKEDGKDSGAENRRALKYGSRRNGCECVSGRSFHLLCPGVQNSLG